MTTSNPNINVIVGQTPSFTRKKPMELLIIPAFVVFWIVLQIWFLPKMGVST